MATRSTSAMEAFSRQVFRSTRWSSTGTGAMERCRACRVRSLSHSRRLSANPDHLLNEESSATTPFAYREMRPSRSARAHSGGGQSLDEGEDGQFRFRASHFRPVVIPMLILSVLTSLAFNLAVARRERREEEDLHVKRKAILQEAREVLSRANAPGNAKSPLHDQDQESRRLALRMIKLGLDPARSGLDVRISDAAAEQLDASALFTSAREVRWSEAFFGKPGAVRSSIAAAVSKAGQAFDGWKMGNDSASIQGGDDETWSEEEVQKGAPVDMSAAVRTKANVKSRNFRQQLSSERLDRRKAPAQAPDLFHLEPHQQSCKAPKAVSGLQLLWKSIRHLLLPIHGHRSCRCLLPRRQPRAQMSTIHILFLQLQIHAKLAKVAQRGEVSSCEPNVYSMFDSRDLQVANYVICYRCE